jgi:hypothetical protein
MAFKRLLQEIEDKFNEINNFSEEPESNDTVYFIEVAVRDARKALETAQAELPGYRGYINNETLWMDGSNVYNSFNKSIIENLYEIFKEWGIDVNNTNIVELEEASTSGGAGAYLTPNAFGHEAPESAITAYGMKKVGAPNKNTKSLKESNYKTMMSEMYSILEEGKYNDIKNNPAVSPKKKVNYAIAEVYTKLYEIEKIISRNMKLKNEMNIDNRMYWKSTKEKLSKLSERLNRVSSYLKNLSA